MRTNSREQPLSSAWTRQRKARLVAAKDQRQGLNKGWWVIPPRHLNMACEAENCGENRALALAGSLRLSRGSASLGGRIRRLCCSRVTALCGAGRIAYKAGAFLPETGALT